jgi:hypothetical protein
MFSRVVRTLLPSPRPDHSSTAYAQGPARRRGSAADSALVSRHGQDLLVGLRHQV